MQSFTETKQFYSLSQKYSGQKSYDLELTITLSSDNTLEFKLVNLNFVQQLRDKLKKLIFLITIFVLQSYVFQIQSNFAKISLLLLIIYFIDSTLNMIKSYTLTYYRGVALQLQTNRFVSKDVYCISSSNIYDIAINEVIERLDIHYILIVRTKGSLFKKKPIIPLFNELKPSVECLNVIYKNLKMVMRMNKHVNARE